MPDCGWGDLALGDENVAITNKGIIVSRTCRPMPTGAIQDMPKFLEQLDWGLPAKGHPSKLPSVRMKGPPGAEFTASPGVMRGRPGTVQLHQYFAECGRTPGCAACQYGAAGRAHSNACNTRRREWLSGEIMDQAEKRAEEVKKKRRAAEEELQGPEPEEKVMRRLRGRQAKRGREEDAEGLRGERKREMMEPDLDAEMKEAEKEEEGPQWVRVTPLTTPVVVPSSSDELMNEARDVKRPAASDELPETQHRRPMEEKLTDQVTRATASDPRCVALLGQDGPPELVQEGMDAEMDR